MAAAAKPVSIAALAREMNTSVPVISRLVSAHCLKYGADKVVAFAAKTNGASLIHPEAAARIRTAWQQADAA